MWYVVTGLVPARIEVRPSNGLGGYNPDLNRKMHELGSTTSKQLQLNHGYDITTTAQGGDNPLNR
jgi:hypothetical protein